MTILITATKSTGETNLIGVVAAHLLDEVQKYCERRNAHAIEAGYHTTYKYERTSASILTEEDLL